jgi:hypothetical protein
MKKIFLILFLFLFGNILFAQNSKDSINPKINFKKNAVFVELYGHSSLGPNFERRLFSSGDFSIFSSIGISYYSNYYDESRSFKFPFRISFCFKNIELGIGTRSITYNFLPNVFTPKIIYYLNQPFIGYRYKNKNHFLFKVSFSPKLYNKIEDEYRYKAGFSPFAGISFGYCF